MLPTIAVSVTTHHVNQLAAAGSGGGGPLPAQVLNSALVDGYTTAFQVAAGLALLAFVLTFFTIRVRPEETAQSDAVPVG